MTDTISRMAQAMYERFRPRDAWEHITEDERNQYRLDARAALGALQGEGMERGIGQTVACLGFGSPPPLREMSAHDTPHAMRLVRELITRCTAPLAARLAEVEAERDAARGALEKYGTHTQGCRSRGVHRGLSDSWGTADYTCDCGFTALAGGGNG